MSQVHQSQPHEPAPWTNEGLDYGVADLYSRRMALVASSRAAARQEAMERLVVTQPFGRPFTAQPSFPPDPPETQGGLAALRKKLAGASPNPRRKLATS